MDEQNGKSEKEKVIGEGIERLVDNAGM